LDRGRIDAGHGQPARERVTDACGDRFFSPAASQAVRKTLADGSVRLAVLPGEHGAADAVLEDFGEGRATVLFSETVRLRPFLA
jgi:hypothetical protein